MVSINGYPLDLVETEEHSLQSDITEHAVEDGSDISDNIRRKPRELTLTNAVVSNTPIGQVALDDSRILIDGAPPPAMDAYRILEQIWLDGEPVTIVTGLKKYDLMGLAELTINRDAKSAGGLVFTAHFKEIRLAKNKRVKMSVPNAGGEANNGLSLDKLSDGNTVLWRKGKPPGLSPATVPPGVIVGTEVVTIQQKPGRTQFLHANGQHLTDAELADLYKDLDRDIALSTRRNLANAEQRLDNIGTATQRANDMAQYKIDHPGAMPDPAQFGLERGPDGHWIAK